MKATFSLGNLSFTDKNGKQVSIEGITVSTECGVAELTEVVRTGVLMQLKGMMDNTFKLNAPSTDDAVITGEIVTRK